MTAGGNPLDNLPELPLEKFEAIGPLERSEHGPFLTIKPPRVEAPPPSAPLPQEKIKVSARKQCHFAWATYPVVVCHDPGPFVDGLQIAGPPSPSDPDRPDPISARSRVGWSTIGCLPWRDGHSHDPFGAP